MAAMSPEQLRLEMNKVKEQLKMWVNKKLEEENKKREEEIKKHEEEIKKLDEEILKLEEER